MGNLLKFIEKESLMFAACSQCFWDGDCNGLTRQKCPVKWAADNADYIEIDEDLIERERKTTHG